MRRKTNHNLIKGEKMWQNIYNKWKQFPKLPTELKKELEVLDENQLEECFYKNLEFGTGGMRGILGVGTNRLNIFTIRKVTQGYSDYLTQEYGTNCSVVIAYDCRHYSKIFAEEAARILATNYINVYLFSSMRPTPELSFAIRYLNAIGGIVITASHNPPEYNGYKLYDASGCQLVPHQVNEIITKINAIVDEFEITADSLADSIDKNRIKIIGKKVDDAYIKKVVSLQLNPTITKEDIKIVYSPLHGTGYELVRSILKTTGYHNVFYVEEQCIPDPNFSTVKSPNPEDPKAFEKAIELAKEKNADIILATDPDADRVALGVKNKSNQYTLLTGNQTATILLYYVLSQKKEQGLLLDNSYVFNTIVTSDMGAQIAKSFGCNVYSTLTGFKFIGEQIGLIENTDKHFLFGYEESCGYLMDDFVRDKDAIQSVLICVEAACYYQQQGLTLLDVLDKLYRHYGYYQEKLINLVFEGKDGAEAMDKLLSRFRESTPTHFAESKVIKYEDYLLGKSFDYQTETELKLILPKSNVLKFYLEDNSWFVIRPSGTEPKVKVYIGVNTTNRNDSNQRIKIISEYIHKFIF